MSQLLHMDLSIAILLTFYVVSYSQIKVSSVERLQNTGNDMGEDPQTPLLYCSPTSHFNCF